MSILLIEDDERIVEFLKRGLGEQGHAVEVAMTGSEGLEKGRQEVYSLIILDVMLPKVDGHEVCQELRLSGIRTPILMLTAMDGLDDVITGLRLGADDYMTKPFSFRELLARIEALLRRGGDYEVQPPVLVVQDISFNRESLEVLRAGRAIELTSKELALLELLMTSAGKVVSRAQILETVWGSSNDPLTNIVEVYIRRLRAKIDEGSDNPLITTIRGRGYRLEAKA